MTDDRIEAPDPTAVRVALWRAMHVQIDAQPHVLEDEIGLKLVAPDEGWRQRPDMHPEGTRGYRASIVARARYVEDLAVEESARGVTQYVLLGGGLDTFAQRRLDIASRLQIFEVDQPAAQRWKRRRLTELGFGVPPSLHLVPVDFEAGESWWEELLSNGFDAGRAALVSSTGVSMYLTHEAIMAMLRNVAALPKGSTFAMTFLLPLELLPEEERPRHEAVYERARAAGTPFISFFTPDRIVELAREAGFAHARYVSTDDLAQRYFNGRADGLRPAVGEAFLVAGT
ncbi:class I SAM-dependent methyltransferase [Trinickia dinghuensis]|uniref:S-adenosyl-L-methionine-dependent methyltransferase n=1 Tax=Trinickia dinghuensis TaxID=2291023 RepID=A0A3D8JUT8_9BURK|nr:class I SAM-dependent methyltransferase [Trinickia dinghuensis]RDU96873.1 SAM-dependent methyltransferase [Trinickia dinghuensis]